MPAQPLEIRVAAPRDVPSILSFIRELASYERLAHEVVATEEQLEHWLFGPRPPAEVVLACRGGEAVGFALFFTSFSTFLGRPGIHLEDLYVRPDQRGGGAGKALLAHLARLTCERGYGRLEWSVLDWNTPAIGFYERLGARPLSDWTLYRLAGEALETLGAAGE